MARDRMMSAVWLVNALENALHEPNCLMKQLIGDGAVASLSSASLSQGEKQFAAQELKTLAERLAMSRELIEQLEAATRQAQQSA